MKFDRTTFLLAALTAAVAWLVYDRQRKTAPPREVVVVDRPIKTVVREVVDPLVTPPMRSYNNRTEFAQIGILTDATGALSQILPLYGRLAPGCRTRYQYYTRTSDYHPVQVRIYYKGRNCMDTHCSSCEEIFDGEVDISVDGYPGVDWKATIY